MLVFDTSGEYYLYPLQVLYFIFCMVVSLIFILVFSFKNSLILLGTVGLALSSTFLFLYLFNSWFSIMTFLVYMGALLVLFFYIFSLHPNPSVFVLEYLKLLPLFGIYVCVFKKMHYLLFSQASILNFYSESLMSFNDVGGFLFCMFMLLCSLWLVSKLGLYNMSSVRPFF